MNIIIFLLQFLVLSFCITTNTNAEMSKENSLLSPKSLTIDKIDTIETNQKKIVDPQIPELPAEISEKKNLESKTGTENLIKSAEVSKENSVTTPKSPNITVDPKQTSPKTIVDPIISELSAEILDKKNPESKIETENLIKDEYKKIISAFLKNWITSFKKIDSNLHSEEEINNTIKMIIDQIAPEHFLEVMVNVNKFSFYKELIKYDGLRSVLNLSLEEFINSILNLLITFKYLSSYDVAQFPIYVKENIKINKSLADHQNLISLWTLFVDLCWTEYQLKESKSFIDESVKNLKEMSSRKIFVKIENHLRQERMIRLLQQNNLIKLFKTKISIIEKILSELKTIQDSIESNDSSNKTKQSFINKLIIQHDNLDEEEAKKILTGRILDAKMDLNESFFKTEQELANFQKEMESIEKNLTKSEIPKKLNYSKKQKPRSLKFRKRS